MILGVFENMVAITFQSSFRLKCIKIIFLFILKKIIFDISTSKQSENIKNINFKQLFFQNLPTLHLECNIKWSFNDNLASLILLFPNFV